MVKNIQWYILRLKAMSLADVGTIGFLSIAAHNNE